MFFLQENIVFCKNPLKTTLQKSKIFVFFIKKHKFWVRYPFNNRTFEHSQKNIKFDNNAVLVRETMLRKWKFYKESEEIETKISEKEPLYGGETEN